MFAKLFKNTRSDKSNDEPLRWIVLDVETTGLDPASDRLLAIAAIAVRVGVGLTKPTIVLGDSFEAVLKQDLASDRDNILVHHIGVGAQEGGRPAKEAGSVRCGR
jgi:DNA polymerase-3 subunit epsilon